MVEVNPKNLKWARQTAGLEIDDIAHKIFGNTKKRSAIEMLRHVEDGVEKPSRAQLERMAKTYRQPLLALYLSEPPRIGDRGEDFRTLPERNADPRANGLLNSLRRNIAVSQGLVREVLEEEFEPLRFVGSATTFMNPKSVAETIVATIDFDLSKYRKPRHADSAFKYLRSCIEKSRIFLLLMSDLGHAETSTIPLSVFRGFVLADDIAPYIVINRKDDVRAQSFTALHELAHLWLGSSGVSGSAAEIHSTEETFCSRVAGHILLPPHELSDFRLSKSFPIDRILHSIKIFANEKHITPSMVAYNLRLHGRIDLQLWRKLDNSYRSVRNGISEIDNDEQVSDAGQPNYYSVKKSQLGKPLIRVTRDAIESELLTLTEAGKILGVNPRVVYPLVNA